MKILIIGKTGMLGDDLAELYANRYTVSLVGEERVDLLKTETLRVVIDEEKPDVVINCAAMTDVDGCERKPELAFQLNGEAPGQLALICKAAHCKLVHISTDYVFAGRPDRAYTEDELPDPICLYGESKLKGEETVRARLADHLIVRIAWLFGYKDKSFVRWIVRKAIAGEDSAIVNDQVGSPSYSMDIGEGISRLLEKGCTGTYHLTNEGICTRYEFAGEILDVAGFGRKKLRPISSKELNWAARRPETLILSKDKLRAEIGWSPPHWKQAVTEYLKREGYGTKEV